MPFLSDLRRFIRIHHLIPAGAQVIVGVSGGPDSLALLHALHALAPEQGWHLHAAHLHHGLRDEAEAEAHFVAELAAAWGLGCTIERVNVRAIAQQPGVSLEEAARQARYAFLGNTARRLGASVVAVGHHADDQVETILMHLLRGSGLAGLRGMLPATDLSQLRLTALHQPQLRQTLQGIRLIRPLLPFSRQAILDYCQKNHLEPRWDLSNLDTTFFRNRLRHQIIPQLKAINPNLTTLLTRTAFVLQGDYQVLDQHRRALWQDLAQVEPGRVRLDLMAFRGLLRGDQRALLRRAILQLRPDHRNISWEHTERVLDILATNPQRQSGGPYTLTAGLVAWLSYQWLDVQETDFIPTDVPQVLKPTLMPLPGQVTLGPSWQLVAQEVRWEPGEAPWIQQEPSPNRIWLPKTIPQPLHVRPRRPGDRMRPWGMQAEKSIKDLMNEHKIPRPERPHWPLLVDQQGRILWLVGFRASAWTQVDADALAAWEIRLEPSDRDQPTENHGNADSH